MIKCTNVILIVSLLIIFTLVNTQIKPDENNKNTTEPTKYFINLPSDFLISDKKQFFYFNNVRFVYISKKYLLQKGQYYAQLLFVSLKKGPSYWLS